MSGASNKGDRMSIPLDLETALRALLAVKPDDPAEDEDEPKEDNAPAE